MHLYRNKSTGVRTGERRGNLRNHHTQLFGAIVHPPGIAYAQARRDVFCDMIVTDLHLVYPICKDNQYNNAPREV